MVNRVQHIYYNTFPQKMNRIKDYSSKKKKKNRIKELKKKK